MTANSALGYDDSFLSAYLDGRFLPDDPVRERFEAELTLNSDLNAQMNALARTRAQLHTLSERLDASPRLPNLTETVMARFRQQYGGLASPQKEAKLSSGSLSSSNQEMTCGHLTPAIICAWVDGELPMPQQILLSQHLNSCSICRRTAEDLRLVSQKLRHVSLAPETALPAVDPWPNIQDHLVYGMTHTLQSGTELMPDQPLSRHPVIVRPDKRSQLFGKSLMVEDVRYQRPSNFSGFAPTKTPFGLALRLILILALALWLWSVFAR